MKFVVNFKTPDAIQYAINNLHQDKPSHISKADWDEAVLDRQAEAEAACKKWFEYDEYCRVEIDTDRGTATVLEA